MRFYVFAFLRFCVFAFYIFSFKYFYAVIFTPQEVYHERARVVNAFAEQKRAPRASNAPAVKTAENYACSKSRATEAITILRMTE